MWESLQCISNNEEQRCAPVNKPLSLALLAGSSLWWDVYWYQYAEASSVNTARPKAAALKWEELSLQLSGSMSFRQLSSLNLG